MTVVARAGRRPNMQVASRRVFSATNAEGNAAKSQYNSLNLMPQTTDAQRGLAAMLKKLAAKCHQEHFQPALKRHRATLECTPAPRTSRGEISTSIRYWHEIG
jgi:hypothetical protein